MRLAALVLVLAASPALADPFEIRGGNEPLPPAPEPQRAEAPRSSHTVELLAGTGAALWVGSFALGIRELRDYNDAVARNDAREANHAVVVERYATTGLFAAGAVALGAAAYVYLTRGRTQTVIAPVVAPDQVGVAFARGF